jgi:excisionase family DNA binding protein
MAGAVRANAVLERDRAIGGGIMSATPIAVDHTRNAAPDIHGGHRTGCERAPVLLTVDETAALLRTTRRAIYAMIERRQLPGVVHIRRRVLLRADDLLHWLDQNRAPSPEE